MELDKRLDGSIFFLLALRKDPSPFDSRKRLPFDSRKRLADADTLGLEVGSNAFVVHSPAGSPQPLSRFGTELVRELLLTKPLHGMHEETAKGPWGRAMSLKDNCSAEVYKSRQRQID